MESQILPVLSKSEVKEEVLCTATTTLGERAGNHAPMETQIQNICVKEVTDLVAQGEPVSFVIVSDREGALEWIENAAVVLDSQHIIRPQENERVIVLETASNVPFSDASETAFTKSRPEDTSAKRDDTETRKRTHLGFLSSQPVSKVIKLSHKDETVTSVSKTDLESKAHDPDNTKVHSYSKIVADANTKFDTSACETSDKNVYLGKGRSPKTVNAQESQIIQVIQGKGASVINIYGSSKSSPPSSTEGSIHSVKIKMEHPPSIGGMSEGQPITIGSMPAIIKTVDTTHTQKVSPLADNIKDHQSIRVSSPGANVEVVVSGDTADDPRKETTPIKELEKVVTVGGVSVNTGLADAGVEYRCGECDYASSNKHYYKQHVDLVHNTARPFKCPFCDYAGKRGHALREHLIVHSAQRPYSCLHCNATFRKKGHLTNHTKLHAASAVSATGFPGGLPGGSGSVNISTAESSLGKIVKIPACMDGNSPVITVTAETSGHLTSVLPSSQKLQPNAAVMAKRSQLWCALCDKEMADAEFFQAHLKNVHGTDRLFACDRCEYVTANKGAILSHLALHIPPSTTEAQMVTVTASPANSSTATSPLYACTECGFNSPKMNDLIVHAASHSVHVVGASSTASASSKPLSKLPQPQQSQISKAICSECGHVADSTESMHAHLWRHISANSNSTTAEVKRPAQPPQEQKPVSESASQHVAEQTNNNSCAIGLKTLPENAAFKCTECSYVSRDASQFVKHMLVHKTQQNQAPRTQAQSSTTCQAAVSGNTVSTSKTCFSYRVKPITTENTCQNTESSPFVHDASTGRFRCTICGYSCEYQRTIKAHIWKHSGHHQVDYPIFQNGPLSMYEDTIPTSQSVTLQGKPSTIQSSAGTAGVRTNVTPSVASQPFSSCSETVRITPPVSAHSGNKTSCASSSSSGAVPVNVKYITVSGSQVLHSSGPLPPGSFKLIPMQSTPVTKPSLSSNDGSKQVIVHVQGSQSEKKPSREQLLIKSDGFSVSVQKTEPQQREISLPKSKDNSVNNVQLKRGAIKESQPQTGAAVEIQASIKSVTQTERNCVTSGTVVDTGIRSESAKTVIDVVSDEKCTSRTAGASIQVPVNPIASIPSARHVLPLCTPVDKQQSRVAVPINSQPDNPLCPVSATSALTTNVTTTSAANTQPLDCGDQTKISTSIQSRGNQHDSVPVEAESNVSDQIGSVNNTEAAACSGETDQSVSENEVLKQNDIVKIEKSLAENQHTSIASRVQSRRQSSRALETEQSVVVETVDTVFNPGSYTGLLSQQTSPRLSRSSNCSPVPAHTDMHTYAHSQGRLESGHSEVSSRILRSAKRRATVESKSVEGMSSGEMTSTVGTGLPEGKSDSSYSNEKVANSQALQESESAATLLSLLQRGSSLNPACPLVTSQFGHIDSKQEQNPPQELPYTSPSSSSETDSIARETAADVPSEDLTYEMESTSSGKKRAGGSGGGICSTLLAVIEQLRERSHSESDAEDKQSQPPIKKRPGRRGDQQESRQEVEEMGDTDNIEQLSGENGVNFRCKLCHYTNPRISLMRLHMRNHRQKDPFECSLCPMVADSSEALQEHMIQHCKVRTYACKFCPQSFSHKSTLRAHMRAHNDSDPFLCDLCEFECLKPLDYRAHMQKHAGSSLLSCPNCPALVASRQDLHIHQAGNCPSTFRSPTPTTDKEKTDHDSNEEMPHGEKFFCPKCEFISTDRSRMEDHMTSHTAVAGMGVELSGEGLLRCALCDFTAVSSRSLKSHMKRHANDQRYVQQPLEQYKCSLCGYVCHHLPSLKSHMWRHASDQNYSYQFTNDVINAAIDYDTRSDPPPQPSRAAGTVSKEADEPELLDKVLSAERKIVEGQMSRPGGSEPVCWVTFCCCQCGFETINKAMLNLHMRTHADIIQRALKVNSSSAAQGEAGATPANAEQSDSVNIKVVYGPV